MLIPQSFTPTTIAQALLAPNIGSIVLVTGCFAVLAGAVIWFLDRFHEDSQFPSEFFPGIGTGIYFAVVTMTSVGYGDYVPKTA